MAVMAVRTAFCLSTWSFSVPAFSNVYLPPDLFRLGVVALDEVESSEDNEDSILPVHMVLLNSGSPMFTFAT